MYQNLQYDLTNDNIEVIYTAKKLSWCSRLVKTGLTNVVLPTFFVVFNNIIEPGSGISMTMLNQISLRTMRPAWIAQHRSIMFSSTEHPGITVYFCHPQPGLKQALQLTGGMDINIFVFCRSNFC